MRSEIARDVGMTNVMSSRFCSLDSILERQNSARTASALTAWASSGRSFYDTYAPSLINQSNQCACETREQVAIRITKVDRYQRPCGASSLYRTQKKRDMTGLKVRDHVLKRHRWETSRGRQSLESDAEPLARFLSPSDGD